MTILSVGWLCSAGPNGQPLKPVPVVEYMCDPCSDRLRATTSCRGLCQPQLATMAKKFKAGEKG